MQREPLNTDEWKRIRRIARRDPADALALGQALNDMLAVGEWRLNATQIRALVDIHDMRGGVIAAGVGHGKTLISMLAPVVCEAQRPLLIVPANLREKTIKEYRLMKTLFRVHPNITIWSYNDLSSTHKVSHLDKLRPDMIICDEAHNVKRKEAARTKRLFRYFDEYPTTIGVFLSGTITRKSIRDYAHLTKYALGTTHNPLPNVGIEVDIWADALDPEPRTFAGLGVLRQLVEGTTPRTKENTQKAYREHLDKTRGLILTTESSADCSLIIQRIPVQLSQNTEKQLAELRALWRTPTGIDVAEPMHLWMYEQQLVQGFCYEWVPPPPDEWKAARKEWSAFVRETIKNSQRSHRPLDSELQVVQAVLHGRYPSATYDAWVAVRDDYKINVRPVWYDEHIVQPVATWLKKHPKSLIWTQHVAVGHKLRNALGIPYFGAGDDDAFLTYAKTQGPCVVSLKAHATGKNLQMYSESLVVSAPNDGATWEQLLGRLHRQGQDADEVLFGVLDFGQVTEDTLQSATERAIYLQNTTGQKQKLLLAAITEGATDE